MSSTDLLLVGLIKNYEIATRVRAEDVKQEAWYAALFIGSQGQEGDLSLWISAVIG